jgi:tRNA/rRNA methyltransferase
MVSDPLRQRCCVVLVRPKIAGNLGAVARAMRNFGLDDLRLVAPEADPLSLEARALATHGEPLLETTQRFPDLVSAVAGCVWVAGTSARLGGLFRRQNVLPIRDGLQLGALHARAGKIAIVFGPEDHGLTTEEVSQCHYLLTIPTHGDYGVLNLAQAVVVCLYEWYLASVDASPLPEALAVAPADELHRMFEHLEEALRAVHYVWGEKGPSVMHALRHLISRARPTELEAKLLHGLARQLLWHVEHHERRQEPQP